MRATVPATKGSAEAVRSRSKHVAIVGRLRKRSFAVIVRTKRKAREHTRVRVGRTRRRNGSLYLNALTLATVHTIVVFTHVKSLAMCSKKRFLIVHDHQTWSHIVLAERRL
jgi:hypothetical protein